MVRKKVFDNCRICGRYTELTFEHVPPKAAFNNCPVVGKHILELINKDPDNYLDGKGHKYQRGVGAYTLCSKCNSNTGGWYGGAFAEWAHQSLNILTDAQESSTLCCRFHIYPLSIDFRHLQHTIYSMSICPS